MRIRSTFLIPLLWALNVCGLHASPESTGVANASKSVTLTPQTSTAWRWRDVAGNDYSADFQTNFSYTDATVVITYDDNSGREVTGHLSATGLKPNFAYQLKLNEWDVFPREQYELIGYSGRWWEQKWDGVDWSIGNNLNIKGTTGLPPNPNDQDYDDRKDLPYTGSGAPSTNNGLLYKYSTYRVFAYFITDEFGSAEVDFAINSSFHVLWKTSQSIIHSHTSNDGIILNHTFTPNPVIHTAYDGSETYELATVGIFGEWERLPNARVKLLPGDYDCQFALTEESFHGGGLDGYWALAMLGDAQFTILPGTVQSTVSQTSSTTFAITTVGSTDDLTLTFLNTGDASLSLLGSPSATTVAGDTGEFTIIAQPTDVLVPPNGSTPMTVQYHPSVAGHHTVTVRLPTNDPDRPTLDVVLTGSAISGNSSLTGKSGFPNLFLGGSKAQTYVVANTGAVALNLTGTPPVSLTGDTSQFSLVTQPTAAIAAGTETRFSLKFRPTKAGVHSVTIIIPSDDPNDPVLSLRVTGRGVVYDKPDREDWRDSAKCGIQQTESPMPFYVLLGMVLLTCMLGRARQSRTRQ